MAWRLGTTHEKAEVSLPARPCYRRMRQLLSKTLLCARSVQSICPTIATIATLNVSMEAKRASQFITIKMSVLKFVPAAMSLNSVVETARLVHGSNTTNMNVKFTLLFRPAPRASLNFLKKDCRRGLQISGRQSTGQRLLCKLWRAVSWPTDTPNYWAREDYRKSQLSSRQDLCRNWRRRRSRKLVC